MPTKLQLSIFSTILNPDRLDNLAESSTAESLAMIGMLTKISNSPILLKAAADNAQAKGQQLIQRPGMKQAIKLIPEQAKIEDVSLSGMSRFLVFQDIGSPVAIGKLTALAALLKAIRSVRQFGRQAPEGID